MSIQFRRAAPHEMDEIYLMGFDVWSEGKPRGEYLVGCGASKKYKSGRWHVLSAQGRLRSSLLVHDFPAWAGRIARGIGSVATAPNARRQGYGHAIVQAAVEALVEKEMAKVIFLYSDIGVRFYEQAGFQALPAEYQSAQGAILMMRMLPKYDAREVATCRHQIPKYF